MFRYIHAIAVNRKRIFKRMNTDSDILIRNIVKVIIYHNHRDQYVYSWKRKCARILEKNKYI